MSASYRDIPCMSNMCMIIDGWPTGVPGNNQKIKITVNNYNSIEKHKRQGQYVCSFGYFRPSTLFLFVHLEALNRHG